MKIDRFLLRSGDIERDSFIWNMAGSVLVAFQSVIMLMIITRTSGLEDAGILTIAYANANLFLAIGKFGMRNFQVSDVKGQFTFGDYFLSRVFSTVAMLAVSVAYILYMRFSYGYTTEKTMVIIWMCLQKSIDAVEDVYHGLYQRLGRLDVAGKCLSLRLAATILIFGAGLVILRELLTSLVIATVCSAVLFALFTASTYGAFSEDRLQPKGRSVALLLRLCLPLCVGSFLTFYIGNAPKYAIDKVLTDELQACYGFIAMPVFVIGLLNSFIFNPILHKMSVLWNEGKIKEFVKRVVIQIGVVAAITLVCILGAYLLGVPVLSWLYHTDLTDFKTELLILLLGGGFLGLSGLLNAINTIIRQQKKLMWGYVGVSILALVFSDRVVTKYEIYGASVLYAVLMGVLCIVFGGILVGQLIKVKNAALAK